MNVGDKVYIMRNYGWHGSSEFLPAKVTRVTPIGQFEVQVPASEKYVELTIRFNADGYELGQRYHGWSIDKSFSFEDREAWIIRYKKLLSARAVVKQINEITSESMFEPTAEKLLEVLTKVNEQVAKAQEIIGSL